MYYLCMIVTVMDLFQSIIWTNGIFIQVIKLSHPFLIVNFFHGKLLCEKSHITELFPLLVIVCVFSESTLRIFLHSVICKEGPKVEEKDSSEIFWKYAQLGINTNQQK